MRSKTILALCLAALSALAQEDVRPSAREPQFGEKQESAGSYRTQFHWDADGSSQYRVVPPSASASGASRGRLRPTPNYEIVEDAKVMRYRNRSDYPDYNAGWDGNGIEVPENGSIPRSDSAVGIETGWINGGGCFPANPADPASPCLTEPDGFGGMRIVWKQREIWTFRMSYIDPTNPNAVETLIGFPSEFGNFLSDDSLTWVRETSVGRRCFTFYSYYCNTYGIDLDYITGSVRGFQPSCAHKRGPGYKAQIFYQYSRYKITDTVPPGENEWEPAVVPATATRLEKPGKVIFARNWAMDMGENAVSFGVSGPLHPQIEANTGYPTAAPTVAPATGKVTLSAYDCGPLAGISASISTDFLSGTSGHAHTSAPSLSDIATVPSSAGPTDADGQWSGNITTGRIASKLRLTAIGSIEGRLFLKTADVSVGFAGLVDPGLDSSGVIRYTGDTTTHPSNHFGAGELHVFIRKMATYYNLLAADSVKGTLGINDMSLERGGLFDIAGAWSPSHVRHRFGTDADIDRFVQRSDGTFVFADQAVIEDAVETKLDGIFLPESGDRMHVQVPEYMVADILLREAQ